jgi:hypothetical protein
MYKEELFGPDSACKSVAADFNWKCKIVPENFMPVRKFCVFSGILVSKLLNFMRVFGIHGTKEGP